MKVCECLHELEDSIFQKKKVFNTSDNPFYSRNLHKGVETNVLIKKKML